MLGQTWWKRWRSRADLKTEVLEAELATLRAQRRKVEEYETDFAARHEALKTAFAEAEAEVAALRQESASIKRELAEQRKELEPPV